MVPLQGLHVGLRISAWAPCLRVDEGTPVWAPIVRRSGYVHAQVWHGRRHAVAPGVCSRIVRGLQQALSAHRMRRRGKREKTHVDLRRRHGRVRGRPVVRLRWDHLAHARHRWCARPAIDHERLWARSLPQEVEHEPADDCEGHDATDDAACDCARVRRFLGGRCRGREADCVARQYLREV